MGLGVSRVMSAAIVVGMAVVALPTRAAAQAAGPFQYHSLTPCRVTDTRTATPLSNQETRTFLVQSVCSVPVGAKAVSVNTTALGPNGMGYLTLFPTGITRPVVSSINFSAGELALGNGALVPLGTYSATPPYDLSVFAKVDAPGGTVHVVIDVTGYFE